MPALDLFDAISLTEAETHFQNTKIVEAQKTQEPAQRGRQPSGKVIPLVVHSAASASANPSGYRPQEHFDPFTVSQSPPTPQTGTTVQPLGR
jgi:hypothetical protein